MKKTTTIKDKLYQNEKKPKRDSLANWLDKNAFIIFFFWIYFPVLGFVKLKEKIEHQIYNSVKEYSDDTTKRLLDGYLLKYFSPRNKYREYDATYICFSNDDFSDFYTSEFKNPIQKLKKLKWRGYGQHFNTEIYEYIMHRYCPEGYSRMYYSKYGKTKAPTYFDWKYGFVSEGEIGVIFYDPDKFEIPTGGDWVEAKNIYTENLDKTYMCSVCGMWNDKVVSECPHCNAEMISVKKEENQ